MDTVIEQLAELRLIPVISIPEVKHAIPLAGALTQAGLPCAEITFRTPAAEESIRILSNQFPQLLIGAGTILNVEQAERAVNAGAKYIVSPGMSPSVVKWCLENKVTVIPGVATPTEIMAAMGFNLGVLKFFPSENLGGIAMLKALYGPFKEIKFIPSGGINPENSPAYLALPNVLAIGGTWFIKESLIIEGKFDEIEKLTREAKRLAQKGNG